MAKPEYFNMIAAANATTSQKITLNSNIKLVKVSVAPLSVNVPQMYCRMVIQQNIGVPWAFLLKEGYPSTVGLTPRFLSWEGEFEVLVEKAKIAVSINNETSNDVVYRINYQEFEI